MHQSSSGEIGTLNIQGRQIAGFQDWEIETFAYPVRKSSSLASKLSLWKGKAKSYWLLEPLPGEVMEAIFYCYNGRELKAVSRNMVKVNLPGEHPLNKKIHAILELRLG